MVVIVERCRYPGSYPLSLYLHYLPALPLDQAMIMQAKQKLLAIWSSSGVILMLYMEFTVQSAVGVNGAVYWEGGMSTHAVCGVWEGLLATHTLCWWTGRANLPHILQFQSRCTPEHNTSSEQHNAIHETHATFPFCPHADICTNTLPLWYIVTWLYAYFIYFLLELDPFLLFALWQSFLK